MTVYVCDSKAQLPKWTCPDMTEDGHCDKPGITCQYRGAEVK
jgi:hypothetical protein